MAKTEKVKKAEVVETAKPLPEIVTEKILDPIPEVKEIPPIEILPGYRKEMDTKLSHGVRVLAFLESRKTDEFVKLNDFLKSLYPIPKPGFPPGFVSPENMRFLKMTLKQLQDDGKIVFANNSFERLGKHYYEGSAPETKYHTILTVPIEAKIPQ